MSVAGMMVVRADADGLHTRPLEKIVSRTARLDIFAGMPLM